MAHHEQFNYNQPDIQFIHCAKCLHEFYEGIFGAEQSPGDALSYAVTAYPLKLGGKNARIVVVWCKRCKTAVWNSRHLVPS